MTHTPNDTRTTSTWGARVHGLEPPYDGWPLWALNLDIEIADIAGDVGAADLEDTPEGEAKLEAYDAVRGIIRRMVNEGPKAI
jgi:hypothetical protein